MESAEPTLQEMQAFIARLFDGEQSKPKRRRRLNTARWAGVSLVPQRFSSTSMS